MALFNVNRKKLMDGDTKYSRGMVTPIYTPSDTCPNVASLYDYHKYSELLRNINDSNVTEEEKTFLRLAAGRHVVFNYALIADYYAHSSPEMQELMEESALIILDIDSAIENGFVTLSKRMEELLDESKQLRGKSV